MSPVVDANATNGHWSEGQQPHRIGKGPKVVWLLAVPRGNGCRILLFDLFEHLQGFTEMLLEVETHSIQDLHESTTAEGIEDLIASLTVDDNALGTQDCQMLRGVCLLHVQLGEYSCRRDFTISEYLHNGNARGMG